MSEVLNRLRHLSPDERRRLLADVAHRRNPTGRRAPLSYAQQRLWFLEQLASRNPYYNETSAFRFSVAVDAAALEHSVNDIVRRHEALRTVFDSIDGEPQQRVLPHLQLVLHVVDRSDVPSTRCESESAHMAEEHGRVPFDLAAGPLLRVTLVRFGPADFLFLLTMHHIVCDGWSMRIFFEEFRLFYEARIAGRTATLPPLSLQYADFSIAQRERLTGPVVEHQIAFWRDQLADVATLDLPTDFPRPLVPTFSGGRERISISAAAYAALNRLGELERATPFMVLLAIFQVLLYRYTGQDDIAVGCPIANRNRPELEQLIGFFVNPLVMRTDLSGNPTMRELLRRVREVALSAYANQDVPFERLVEELHPTRDPSRNPLFQVTFQMLRPPADGHAREESVWHTVAVETATAKFDLRCDLWEVEGGVEGYLEYSGDLFAAATVEAMARHFEMLVESVGSGDATRVAELRIIPPPEEKRLVIDWNLTGVDFGSTGGVHQMFEQCAARQADAPAVTTRDSTLTFGQLNGQANQLARHLRTRGIVPGSLVAVVMDRSNEYVLAILAILKAGAAYVPLDPTYPQERLLATMADSVIQLVLTQARYASKVPGYISRQYVDTESALWAGQPFTNLPCQVDERSLAYVIFTSGSTGRPKGVEVLHSSLSNLVSWHRRQYKITPEDRATLYASPAFDASVWEMWPYLTSGASLWVPGETTHASPEDLAGWLADNQITVAFLPTPMVESLLSFELPARLVLRALLTGGDKLHAYPARPLSFRLFNHYGPTENAVVATFAEVTAGPESEVPPIGRPIANVRAYVLDRFLRPVPIGVRGELYLAGAGLARGYLNDAALTKERFVPDPFDPRRGSRMYRTGDLVRFRRDGNLEFHGRVDRQVKIRGSRTELGDIETALGHHPTVHRSLVVPHETADGDTTLIAYIVRQPDATNAAALSVSAQTERTDEWRHMYDGIYRTEQRCPDPTFDIVGWNSSYTGQPLSAEEMKEQVEATVGRIGELGGRRILEVGCGTGLLLFRLAGKCERYVATDFSAPVVESVRQECERRDLAQVEVLNRSADDFSGIEPGTYDGVIINSVVQYFPSMDYLISVLSGAVRVVRAGGWIFVGDVRCRPLLSWLHAGIELARSSDDTTVAELRARMEKRRAQEQELVIDPEFFSAWGEANLRGGDAKVEVKRGRHSNELVMFRFDVVLSVGEGDGSTLHWEETRWEDFGNAAALKSHLHQHQPSALLVRGVPSARLVRDRWLMQVLDAPNARTAVEIREDGRKIADAGVDPEALWELEADVRYTIRIGWGEPHQLGCYTVYCVPRSTHTGRWQWRTPPVDRPAPNEWVTYANVPVQEEAPHQRAQNLREYLRQRLPEHMVPAQYVWIERLPVTPNGKLDRRALPPPASARGDLARGYSAPGNALEESVAAIWSEVLGVERVGVNTNFFDLGGHSLLLVRVHSRLRKTLQTSLSVIDLFLHPTVRSLAQAISASAKSDEPRAVHSLNGRGGPMDLRPMRNTPTVLI